MKKATLKKLHTTCFHLHNILNMIKLEMQSRLAVAGHANIKGSTRELLCGDGMVLHLDCDGSYMNLHME